MVGSIPLWIAALVLLVPGAGGYPVADPLSCPDLEGEGGLLDFVRGLGGTVSGIAFRHQSADERSVVASRDVGKGEVLGRVPEGATMSLYAALRQSEGLQEVLEEVLLSAEKERFGTLGGGGGSGMQELSRMPVVEEEALLVLILLHEALNATSRWRPYICSLPRAVDLPLAWTEDKLRERLAAAPDAAGGLPAPHPPAEASLEGPSPSAAHGTWERGGGAASGRLRLNASQQERYLERVGEQQRGMGRAFEEALEGIVERHPRVFPRHLYTEEAWRWGFSVVVSRAWRVEPPGALAHVYKTMSVLVPLADMFNHKQAASVLGREEGSFLVSASEDAREGGEVFISYGSEKCNDELLSNYGFVLPEIEC